MSYPITPYLTSSRESTVKGPTLTSERYRKAGVLSSGIVTDDMKAPGGDVSKCVSDEYGEDKKLLRRNRKNGLNRGR